jgi:hypothetical protein
VYSNKRRFYNFPHKFCPGHFSRLHTCLFGFALLGDDFAAFWAEVGGLYSALKLFLSPAQEGKLVKYVLFVLYLSKIIILSITGCRTTYRKEFSGSSRLLFHPWVGFANRCFAFELSSLQLQNLFAEIIFLKSLQS